MTADGRVDRLRGAGDAGRGGGGRLVKALLAEAKRHRVGCICLFTRKPEFFAAQGFSVAQRDDIPDKIYKDCHACPRFHCCDEVAMVRGDLPKFAILPEPAGFGKATTLLLPVRQ